jgi:phytoene/squalene synthetase
MFTRLSESCETVRGQCSEQEYKAYIKGTAGIAGSIVMDVMEPLYKKHPQLRPHNWDDDGSVWN